MLASPLTCRSPGPFSSLRHIGGDSPPEARWRWSILRLDDTGRLMLPSEAREALGLDGGPGTVWSACRGIVLRLGVTGTGVAVSIDRRGRVLVPACLRQAAGASGSVLVAAAVGVEALVLVAPSSVLDGLAEMLVGEKR